MREYGEVTLPSGKKAVDRTSRRQVKYSNAVLIPYDDIVRLRQMIGRHVSPDASALDQTIAMRVHIQNAIAVLGRTKLEPDAPLGALVHAAIDILQRAQEVA
jgi:hypothetical protein